MFTEPLPPPSSSSSSAYETPDPDPSPDASPLLQSSLLQYPTDSVTDGSKKDEQTGAPEQRHYVPHAVGIGIVSPRPQFGPLSAFYREETAQTGSRSSPVQTRLNPFDSPSEQGGATLVASPSSPPPHNSFDPLESMLIPPSLHLTEEGMTGDVSFDPPPTIPPEQRPSSPGANAENLRITIPLPNHSNNPFVPPGQLSPPPSAASPSSHPTELIASPTQVSTASLDLAEELPLPNTNDLSSALNIDFAEFETENLSTLEKIYLLSRSRAGFQRVFIAHALPEYLRATFRENGQQAAPSSGGAEQLGQEGSVVDTITPAEAVEYVLPLLNGLAMDEDEAVKEALATELVPIIWWFITHCKVVQDDTMLPLATDLGLEQGSADPATDEPTPISVQAFTPILGTLLLSPNGMVGGPARFTVVELLNRVRRADQRDRQEAEKELHIDTHITGGSDGQGITKEEDRGGTTTNLSNPDAGATPEEEEEEYSPVGHFGFAERRLFEREMVQQVVIGMGRLDIPDDSLTYGLEEGTDQIPDTTAIPTPHASHGSGGVPGGNYAEIDEASYFPVVKLVGEAPQAETAVVEGMSSIPSMDEELPDVSSLSSPAQPLPSSSFVLDSPLISPAPSPAVSPVSLASTPSLCSASSSSASSTPASAPSDLSSFPTTTEDPVDIIKSAFTSNLESTSTSTNVTSWQPLSPVPSSSRSAPPILSCPSRIDPLPMLELQVDEVPMPPGQGIPEPSIIAPVPEQAPGWFHTEFAHGLEGMSNAQEDEIEGSDEQALNEEASVGRLSSMSLMAAVTASGSIDEATKVAFVAEVERVGRDPVYWVRREASFAVGALAKVVPTEIVISSLLPLFETLYHDSQWQVRHSALFALPAILTRLPTEQRRMLALDTILSLSTDESATVRSGVLEALAEVIYTFHDDEDGPPDELLWLFLGIRPGEDPTRSTESPSVSLSLPSSPMSWSEFVSSVSSQSSEAANADIYDDASRPLVCAFNFPAVTLTLGKERWHELRELYLELSRHHSFKVRRTLAASLGEIAKIVGPEHAKKDLMGVWWTSVRSEEGEVRLKALECLETFVVALAVPERVEVVKGLVEELWQGLRGWRERECIVRVLGAFVRVEGIEEDYLMKLLQKGLTDSVATVREAAVSTMSACISVWSSRQSSNDKIWSYVRELAASGSYRERMTFIACYQALLMDERSASFLNDEHLQVISTLAQDSIVDVRIRVSRLLGSFQDKLESLPKQISCTILDLATHLADDPSLNVKAFVEPLVNQRPTPPPRQKEASEVAKNVTNFSRPPPPGPS